MGGDQSDVTRPNKPLLGDVDIEHLQFRCTSDVAVVRAKSDEPLSVRMVLVGGTGITCMSVVF